MNAGVLDIHFTGDDAEAALAADARAGLSASPKCLPPKWFYDARGSELFEEITQLPEYYPTRTERALLDANVDEIAALPAADTFVELGSGSSAKTRLLLDAFRRAGTLATYVPQDVSASALRAAMDALAPDYPGLALHGVVGDFTRHLDRLPRGGRRTVAFLGGTIGNLRPRDRAAFLTELRAVLRPGSSSCSARAWSSTSRRWWRPTTTRRASRRRSTATSCACSTASSRPTSPPTRSTTTRCGTRGTVDRDAAAGAAR
jgi:L-histidine N-alpha-methyltransferase